MPQFKSTEPTDPTESTSIAEPARGAERPSHSPRWRRFLKPFALLPLAGLLSLPLLLAGRPLKAWLQRRLSRELHLTVRIGRLSLAWWRRVRAFDLELLSPAGQRLLTLDELRTERSLWRLAVDRSDVGRLHLIRPRVEVELTPQRLNEWEQAARRIEPAGGLLGKVLSPRRDVDAQLSIAGAAVHGIVGGRREALIAETSVNIAIQRRCGRTVIEVEPGYRVDIALAPLAFDLGLQYVLPVLSKVVQVKGAVTLELEQYRLVHPQLEESRIAGQLTVHGVDATTEVRIVQDVAGLVGAATGRSLSGSVRLAERCQIAFRSRDAGVEHQGLRFGLPGLPQFQIESQGHVGFDQSLDLLFTLSQKEGASSEGEGRVVRIPVGGDLRNPLVGDEGHWVRALTKVLRGEPGSGAEALDALRIHLDRPRPSDDSSRPSLSGAAFWSGWLRDRLRAHLARRHSDAPGDKPQT